MKTATMLLLLGTLLAPAALGAQPASTPATSLHVAVLAGDLGAVRAHVEAGADLDARDAFGSTPLLIAATFARAASGRALLDAGADPDLRRAGRCRLRPRGPVLPAARRGGVAARTLRPHAGERVRRGAAGRVIRSTGVHPGAARQSKGRP